MKAPLVFALLFSSALFSSTLAQQSVSTMPDEIKPDDLGAQLKVLASSKGALSLTLTVESRRSAPLELNLGRNNAQGCAFAPLVRVLKVGSREVVYPRRGESSLCTQEMQITTLAAGRSTTFKRSLKLSPGKYMIESWLAGFANGQPVRLVAAPVAVTVK